MWSLPHRCVAMPTSGRIAESKATTLHATMKKLGIVIRRSVGAIGSTGDDHLWPHASDTFRDAADDLTRHRAVETPHHDTRAAIRVSHAE
jgi:hypothetical protein